MKRLCRLKHFRFGIHGSISSFPRRRPGLDHEFENAGQPRNISLSDLLTRFVLWFVLEEELRVVSNPIAHRPGFVQNRIGVGSVVQQEGNCFWLTTPCHCRQQFSVCVANDGRVVDQVAAALTSRSGDSSSAPRWPLVSG